MRALASLGRRGVTAAAWRATLLQPGGRPAALAESAQFSMPRKGAGTGTLERDLDWLEASGTHLLECVAPEYPRMLAATATAPAVLYVRGNVAALDRPQIAIVGSREPTPGGRASAAEFAFALGQAGFTIVSGLARGIDAAGHRAALKDGTPTIAVFATGVDAVYPREHEGLAREIVASGGALVSEMPPRSPPRRHSFPRRNRLLSGLAAAVLVVEAGVTSGSLHTAAQAWRAGRLVFALPGSVANPLTRGCHALIRSGARLVRDPADLLSDLNIPSTKQLLTNPEARRFGPRELDKAGEILLDACGFDPTSFDVLVERTGFPAESVASLLLVLELDGLIEPHPGGRYGRVQQGRG